ncbi:GD24106 [Drosophila simulans]|uniref:GD24106 n=1 Tax=Drosophila simulans TaxID=7240 RepID=B4Q7W8_DROSI|nr:GD24106 [Drosophila simulans]
MYTAIVTETKPETEMPGRTGLESGEDEKTDGDKDAATINCSQLKFHFGHHF